MTNFVKQPKKIAPGVAAMFALGAAAVTLPQPAGAATFYYVGNPFTFNTDGNDPFPEFNAPLDHVEAKVTFIDGIDGSYTGLAGEAQIVDWEIKAGSFIFNSANAATSTPTYAYATAPNFTFVEGAILQWGLGVATDEANQRFVYTFGGSVLNQDAVGVASSFDAQANFSIAPGVWSLNPPQAVPLPSAFILSLSAVAGMVGVGRRRTLQHG